MERVALPARLLEPAFIILEDVDLIGTSSLSLLRLPSGKCVDPE